VCHSAWNFFITLIIAHFLLLFFTDTLGSIGCALVIVGASFPVCCLVNNKGWAIYIVCEIVAICFFFVDTLEYRSYAGKSCKISCRGAFKATTAGAFGIGIGAIGLWLAGSSIRYVIPKRTVFTQAVPIDGESHLHPVVLLIARAPSNIPTCEEHAQPVHNDQKASEDDILPLCVVVQATRATVSENGIPNSEFTVTQSELGDDDPPPVHSINETQ
jgi:hypothetical protein